MTAAGFSSAEVVTTKPAFSTSSMSPAPPITRMVDAAGTSSASNRTAACGEVTTSSASTDNPRLLRCSATDSAVREALLVMYPTRASAAAAFIASTAKGIASEPL
jgi:hypothetical protein